MKNVKSLAVRGSTRRATEGGVTTKTLLATALFAALATTSITSQAQATAEYSGLYFDYGTGVTAIGGGAANYQQGTLAGLQLNGAEGTITDVAFSAGAPVFGDGKPTTPANVVPFSDATTNYSILIVGQGTVNGASAAGVSLTVTQAQIGTVPKNLETLTGFTVLSGGTLNFKDVTEKNLTVALGVTGQATSIAGLNLVGLDLSAGGTYTGGTGLTTGDSVTVFATDNKGVGGNATAINLGSGTLNIGGGGTESLTATAEANSSAANTAGLSAYGVMITDSGKLQDVAETTGVVLGATVDYSTALTKPIKGEVTATAAGVDVAGGTLSLATTGSTNVKVNITGEVKTEATGTFQGTANAYGINATNGATVTIGNDESAEVLKITGTVGQGTGAVGNANAYGIFASGNKTEVTINAGTATGGEISATIGTNANGISGVNQLAAALYATETTVSINGGSNGLAFKATNESELAEKDPGTSSVYGIYVDQTTLDLAGTITIEVTPPEVEAPVEGLTSAALYAANSFTTITGTTTATTGDVVFEQGGSLTIGSAQGEAAASLTVTEGDFSSTDLTEINIIGGKAVAGAAKLSVGTGNIEVTNTSVTLTGGAGATAAAGLAAIEITTSGDATFKNSSLELTGGAGGASGIGGDATITLKEGALTISGAENVTLQGGAAADGQAGGNATITLTDTSETASTISNSNVTITGGAATASTPGGNASLIVTAGDLTVTNSTITLAGGTKATVAGGTAALTITAGTFTLGTDGATDGSTITVGNGATLTFSEAANTFDGTTIKVAAGGTLVAGTALNVGEGATLLLEQTAKITAGSSTSTIDGTLTINGTSKLDEEVEGSGPYAGGLGTMGIGGEVTSDGPLYLELINDDKVTFNKGGTMTAQEVSVGTAEGATSTLTVNGGNITIENLVVGATGATSGTVTLTAGSLTLGEPQAATEAGEPPTSALTIDSTTGHFTLNGGTLVTNSQNLWEEAASKALEEGTESLTSNIGGEGEITYDGGFVELTDEKVDVSWLGVATGEIESAQFIIDGTLQQNGKAVTSILPSLPAGQTGLAFGTGNLAGVNLLPGTTLNAAPQTFKNEGKETSYSNLVIGGNEKTKTPWDQGSATLWSIDPDDPIGFANVNIGDGGNILVTGGDTLKLAGNGTDAVTGNGVSIYLGTQGSTTTGNLTLGITENNSKGGAINGNVMAYNGTLTVQYAPYSITGTLTLGQAQTGGSGQPVVAATSGFLVVSDKGSLTVGSIAGGNVGNETNSGISITGGSTLTVNGNMDVTLVTLTTGDDEFSIDDSTLTVAQDLTVSATPKATGPVVMVATDSTVTAGSLTANNAMIGLDGSTMTINGALNQNAANSANLALAAVSESKLTVTGDLTTQATTVWANDSEITVGGTFTAGQAAEGTAAPTITKLILDGATISAGTINLTNVNTALFNETNFAAVWSEDTEAYESFYLSGDITATSAMNLAGSTIELDSGSLTAGALSLDKDSTLTLGKNYTEEGLEALNEDLTAAGKATVTDIIVQASIGSANVAGDVFINGTSAESQTKVAIGNLAFATDATADNATTMVVTGDSALILGSNDTAAFNPAVISTQATRAATAPEITTYLVAGQTVQLGLNNGFAIGTTAPATAQNSGVSIGDGAAVIIDPELLAQNGAVYGDVGERQADLFFFDTNTLEEGQTAPEISVSQNAIMAISKPLGNLTINLAHGLDPDEAMTLSNEQLVQPDNPLYGAEWAPEGLIEGSDPAEYNIPKVVIKIKPEEVSGQPESLNSLGTNTILDAADIGYGFNTGADRILDLLSTATSANKADDYIRIRDQINQWALQGAAAHAHEIGISAASMVVDSVWDHSSKLAAAPHEEAKGDVWITLDWNHSRANDYKAGGLDNGYKLDLYGATFGADYDFANGLAAGLAVSVGGGEAKSKGINAGQKTDVTYWGINLYGTYASPIVNVIGNVGYIGIKNKTKVGGDKGRPDANIWTIGVKAEKDFAINEQFTVTPHVGVRYLSVDVDDFNLGGFHYGTDKANLVQFPIGVAFAANLKTANGASVKPFLDLSFVPTAGDKKVDNTFGITGGNASDVIDTTIASTSMFQGKIGVNASYGAHNFGLNFAIGGGNKGRLDTGLQAKYRFVF